MSSAHRFPSGPGMVFVLLLIAPHAASQATLAASSEDDVAALLSELRQIQAKERHRREPLISDLLTRERAKGQSASLREAMGRILAEDRDDPALRYRVGCFLLDQKFLASAERELNQALRMDAASPVLKQKLAQVAWLMFESERAATLWDEAGQKEAAEFARRSFLTSRQAARRQWLVLVLVPLAIFACWLLWLRNSRSLSGVASRQMTKREGTRP